MERKLRTQRRKMLRYVFRVHRLREESWVEYMKRTAEAVDDFAADHSMRDLGRGVQKSEMAGRVRARSKNRRVMVHMYYILETVLWSRPQAR